MMFSKLVTAVHLLRPNLALQIVPWQWLMYIGSALRFLIADWDVNKNYYKTYEYYLPVSNMGAVACKCFL